MKYRSIIFVLSLLFIVQKNVSAAVITWTGDGGTSNWSNPDNWDLDQVPAAIDSVFTGYGDIINIPVGYNVHISYIKLLGTLAINPSAELIIDGKFNALGDVLNFGTITINNSLDEGLFFSTQAADRQFDNYGIIYINNAATNGLEIRNGQVFRNHEPGYIEINNSGSESFNLSGKFYNYGEIKLIDSAIDIALSMTENVAEIDFINYECGRVVLRDQLVLTLDTLTNYGYIRQNYDGDNDVDYLLSRLDNFGVIEDISSSFSSLDFDTQSIWVKKLENIQIKTGEPTSLFVVEMQNGFSFSDIYTDNLLTEHAGTFGNDNIWIPNTNANGNSVFFAEITDDSENCSDTVRIELEFPVQEVVYWTGGTGNWQFGLNWSTGSVPSSNDIACIYNSTDEVMIPIGYTAESKNIFLEGSLTVGLFATLNLVGDNLGIGIDVNEGSIVNNGTINLTNFFTCIYARNSSINNGKKIDCNGCLFCIEIYQNSGLSASLVNNVLIENDSGNLIYGNETPIINNGTLKARLPNNTGIYSDNLDNYGIIDIEGNNNNFSRGVYGSIINNESALINLKNLTIGIEMEGENHNLIVADSCETGIKILDDFTNHPGAIMAASHSGTGLFMTKGAFTNKEEAIITLSQNEDFGLVCSSFTNPTLFNEGMVTVDSTNGIGVMCYNNIFNQAFGHIDILNSASHGLYAYSDVSDIINKDNGYINIKNSNGHAFIIEGGEVINQDNGIISIDSSLSDGIYIGIYNFFFSNYYGSISNSAEITIGQNIQQDGIHLISGTSLTNLECTGNINNGGSLNIAGTFENDGIYRHLSSGTNTFSSALQNDGVLFDPFQNLSLNNIFNNGLYIDKLEDNYSEGDTIDDILHLNSNINTGFEIDSTWYVDPQLNTPAGKYNMNLNKLYVYGLAVDSSTFYFRIKNTTCSPTEIDTFSLHMDSPITKKCGHIVWEGGTGLWTNPEKWNLYRLPSVCDSVMIYGVLDSILVNSTDSVIVDYIRNDGYILITPQGNLNIKDYVGNALFNKGKILNKGNLTISNHPLNGYIGAQGSEFINEGMFTIDNIGSRGIILNEANLQNKASGTINLENIALDDFKLNDGSLFMLKGIMNIRQ